MAIPAFFSGPQAAANHATVVATAPPNAIIVLNPDITDSSVAWNDPSIRAYWQDLVQRYQNGLTGCAVLGYVPTDGGTGAVCVGATYPTDVAANRTLQDLKTYVDRWKTLAPKVDGIFFDEGPYPERFTGAAQLNVSIAQCVRDLYREAYQYAVQTFATGRPNRPSLAGNNQGLVLLNASQFERDDGGWIMTVPDRACDVAILWENNACQYFAEAARPTNVYPTNPPNWWTQNSPDRVGHTVLGCHNRDDLRQVIALSKQRNAGYVFVYDRDKATYDRLPAYWADEPPAVVGLAQLPAAGQPSNTEFHVRDWTDSATIFDSGQEPSTNPVFYLTSDVWSTRTPSAPAMPFDANDQPVGENPIVDSLGTNYAYARVHRPPCRADSAQTVSLRFLRADFGLGTTFVMAGTASDPTLTFNLGEWRKLLTAGYPWTLPASSSDHVCLAVEISTPADPVVTSLLGKAAGSLTDPLVVKDNNIAQRNLEAVRVLVRSPHKLTAYAVAHNPAFKPSDLHLRYRVPKACRRAVAAVEVEAIDLGGNRTRLGKERAVSMGVRDMAPLESRWLAISVELTDQTSNAPIPIVLEQVVDDQVVNGFAIVLMPVPLTVLLEDLIVSYVQTVNRVALIRLESAELWQPDSALNTTLEQLGRRTFSLLATFPHMEWIQDEAAQAAIGLEAHLEAARAAAARGDVATSVLSQAQLLRDVNVILTMESRRRGDVADVAPLLRWQAELYEERRWLRRLAGAHELVTASRSHIEGMESRQRSDRDYAELIRSLAEVFQHTSVAAGRPNEGLSEAVQDVFRNQDDIVRLAGSHRQLLLGIGRVSDVGGLDN